MPSIWPVRELIEKYYISGSAPIPDLPENDNELASVEKFGDINQIFLMCVYVYVRPRGRPNGVAATTTFIPYYSSLPALRTLVTPGVCPPRA